MPNHPCPLCQQPGRRLEITSGDQSQRSVYFYRCAPCAHIWVLSEADPEAPAVDVIAHA